MRYYAFLPKLETKLGNHNGIISKWLKLKESWIIWKLTQVLSLYQCKSIKSIS